MAETASGGSRRLRSGSEADVDAYRLVDGRLFLFCHVKEERFAADEAFVRGIAASISEVEVVGIGRALKTEDRSEPLAPVWLAPPPSDGVLWSVEGDLRFRLEATSVLNPGLFLDQRENRARLAELCRAARAARGADVSVLNLFSYTGSFSTVARGAGAVRTTSVDVSARYLAWERANFDANFSGSGGDPPRLIRADARDFLRRGRKRGDRYRYIVIDPPTFSRGEGKPFRVETDLPALIDDALACLSEKGPAAVFASTNDARWPREKLLDVLSKAARNSGTELAEGSTPKDFGPAHPLKSAWLVRA